MCKLRVVQIPIKAIQTIVISASLANLSVALHKLRESTSLQTAVSRTDCCTYQNLGKGSCIDEDGGLPAYYYEVQGYTQPTCQNICDKDDLCTGYSIRELMPGRLPGCYIFAGGRSGLPIDEIPQVRRWAFHFGTGSLLPITGIINSSQYTCMKKQIDTCILDHDSQVHAFDGRQFSLLFPHNASASNSSGKWLVKSGRVSIQASIAEMDVVYNRSMFVRSIAVGGSFLKGNILIIGALGNHITWNGESVLDNQSVSFEVEQDGVFVNARHSKQSLLVQDLARQSAELNVTLPLGVKLFVNRLRDRINVVIKMPPQKGGLGGICGNLKNWETDESVDAVVQRSDPNVTPKESLFGEQRNVRRIQLVQRSLLMPS